MNVGTDSLSRGGGWADYAAPLALFAAAAAMVAWLRFAQGAGTPGDFSVLVFPPGWSAAETFAAAAALEVDIVAQGPLAFLLVVAPRDGSLLDDAPSAGAWMVLNAEFAGLCGQGG